MKVPPKVKMLLWHACCKAMPTKNSLFRHTISMDPLCVRCHTSSETSLHAKWSFPELDSEWAEVELWSCQGSVQFLDFKELLSWLIKNKCQVELFVVIAWTIWN